MNYPFNSSWLKDAVDKLLVYYTPDNVIRKVKADAIYGNPPFKRGKINLKKGGAMTQEKAILDWLQKGNCITPMQALQMFGCFRLGARIWDLVRQGYHIKTKMITTTGGKRVAQYRMEGKWI